MFNYVWLFVWTGSLSPDNSFNSIPVFAWRVTWDNLKAILAVRNFDWQDDASLWARAAKTNPQSAKVDLNLEKVYLEIGRVRDAIAEYESALRIYPDYTLAHYSLVMALLRIPANAGRAG